MKELLALMLFLTLISFGCSSNCTSCSDGVIEQEICEDDGINYTDQNGNLITWEEAILLLRSQGYNCN